jgi:hypothetical protein
MPMLRIVARGLTADGEEDGGPLVEEAYLELALGFLGEEKTWKEEAAVGKIKRSGALLYTIII